MGLRRLRPTPSKPRPASRSRTSPHRRVLRPRASVLHRAVRRSPQRRQHRANPHHRDRAHHRADRLLVTLDPQVHAHNEPSRPVPNQLGLSRVVRNPHGHNHQRRSQLGLNRAVRSQQRRSRERPSLRVRNLPRPNQRVRNLRKPSHQRRSLPGLNRAARSRRRRARPRHNPRRPSPHGLSPSLRIIKRQIPVPASRTQTTQTTRTARSVEVRFGGASVADESHPAYASRAHPMDSRLIKRARAT